MWDFFTNIFYMCAYFNVPYCIAFGLPIKGSDNSSWEHAVEITLDIVFLCDIIITFMTDVDHDPGEKITNATIAYRYVSTYFVFDVVSCMPGLITKEIHNGTHWIYWLKFFRYAQLFRTFSQIENLLRVIFSEGKKHFIKNAISILTLNI